MNLMNIRIADDQAKQLQGLPVTTRAYVRTTEQVFDGETAALPVTSEPDCMCEALSPIVEIVISKMAA